MLRIRGYHSIFSCLPACAAFRSLLLLSTSKPSPVLDYFLSGVDMYFIKKGVSLVDVLRITKCPGLRTCTRQTRLVQRLYLRNLCWCYFSRFRFQSLLLEIGLSPLRSCLIFTVVVRDMGRLGVHRTTKPFAASRLFLCPPPTPTVCTRILLRSQWL